MAGQEGQSPTHSVSPCLLGHCCGTSENPLWEPAPQTFSFPTFSELFGSPGCLPELYSWPYCPGAHSPFHTHVDSIDKHKHYHPCWQSAHTAWTKQQKPRVYKSQSIVCGLEASALRLDHAPGTMHSPCLPMHILVLTSGPLFKSISSLRMCSPPHLPNSSLSLETKFRGSFSRFCLQLGRGCPLLWSLAYSCLL